MASEISNKFGENPAELLNEAGQLAPEEKVELMALEEAIVAARYQESLGRSTITDENAVAEKVDSGSLSGLPEFEISQALAAMNRGEPAPVPGVLKSVVQRSCDAEKPVRTPSLVLKLGEAGLSVLKSALDGLYLVPQEFTPTRSAAVDARPRIDLRQTIEGGLGLEYQVVQEGAGELMLVVRFRERPQGVYRIDLLENERTVDSQMLGNSGDHVTFGRIAAGAYEVDITGPVSHRFGLFVETEG